MTRHHNQYDGLSGHQQIPAGFQESVLFACMGTGSHYDGTFFGDMVVSTGRSLASPILMDGQIIKLEITCHMNLCLPGTHGDNPARIVTGLHAEGREIPQNAAKKRSKSQISAKRSIGDPAICQYDGNTTPVRLPQKIGPYFSFHDDDQ